MRVYGGNDIFWWVNIIGFKKCYQVINTALKLGFVFEGQNFE